MPENNDYNPDIVSVSDDDGKEYQFEVLDRIETDDARYVALTPADLSDEDILNGAGELIILRVQEDEDGETYLCPIEDDKEFNEIGDIFEERLSEFYDFEEIDKEAEESIEEVSEEE